eukprot:187662-Prymnesium_polylepis.1
MLGFGSLSSAGATESLYFGWLPNPLSGAELYAIRDRTQDRTVVFTAALCPLNLFDPNYSP